MVTNPTFLRVPDPSNGSGQLTQHPPIALDQTVTRWLREGAPRVNSRSNPNPTTRPFIPAALLSFFDGSLPQCSQLIAQHLANSSSHVRTAAQEFGRTDAAQKFTYTRLNTEVIDCCRVYHLPPTPFPGSLPSPAGASPAQGTAGSTPASALNVRPPRLASLQSPPHEAAPAEAKEKEKAKGKVKTPPCQMGTLLIQFSWWLLGVDRIWLRGWALLPLPCSNELTHPFLVLWITAV